MLTMMQNLLKTIADLPELNYGAYNLRANGKGVQQHSTDNISITSKIGIPGIDIKVKPGAKGEVAYIPVVVTVVAESTDIQARLDAGADILNVSGAARTPEIVAHIREIFPEVPIIATGGPTDDTIRATIEAGANAITYTPPTSAELFSESMRKYRGRFA